MSPSSSWSLGLALTDLDVATRARAAMRWVGGLLLLLAATLAGMYGVSLVRQAVTGELPVDVLPLPQAQVRLGMALDLAMVVPTLVLAGSPSSSTAAQSDGARYAHSRHVGLVPHAAPVRTNGAPDRDFLLGR
ncbi:hypothetical protein ACU635_34195 [[Actinomadura] parvosata]|uniref:hypothetical protein n=1 Tax=[Actinomadura] parvosata TaxID=1955412 RepID=UPI00406C0FB4